VSAIHRRRAQAGYTLLEVVVSIVVFGFFLFILTTLQTEMRRYERAHTIDFMRHPQVIAVLSRMRKDVLDAFGPDPYPATFTEARTAANPDPQTYEQSSQTLIITSVQQTGFIQTIVWDARTKGEMRRRSYSVGKLSADWIARDESIRINSMRAK
jgi:prepilin-type N-terminal cleavage/methylation domain-containing protein